jgi:hypothetical protein
MKRLGSWRKLMLAGVGADAALGVLDAVLTSIEKAIVPVLAGFAGGQFIEATIAGKCRQNSSIKRAKQLRRDRCCCSAHA